LAKALAEKVGGESLQLNSVVIGLASNQQGNPLRNNWTVSYLKGGSSKKEQKNFDAVILTTPFHEMQQLGVMKDGQKYPLDYFPEVVYQPMSVLVMAFETDRVKQALEGFGILVPRKEQANGFQTLGTLFSSSMFPDRAPAGQVVFTTFIGGSRNRALAAAPLEVNIRTALDIAVSKDSW
jgi:oxygen-dependent protoporphyrinogen oxidase